METGDQDGDYMPDPAIGGQAKVGVAARCADRTFGALKKYAAGGAPGSPTGGDVNGD